MTLQQNNINHLDIFFALYARVDKPKSVAPRLLQAVSPVCAHDAARDESGACVCEDGYSGTFCEISKTTISNLTRMRR